MDALIYNLYLIFQNGLLIILIILITNNVTDMRGLFYNCYSLSSLPDISKWNINNVFNISCLFYNCYSLSSLPDISKSKWDISQKRHKYMFVGCIQNLKNLESFSSDESSSEDVSFISNSDDYYDDDSNRDSDDIFERD